MRAHTRTPARERERERPAIIIKRRNATSRNVRARARVTIFLATAASSKRERKRIVRSLARKSARDTHTKEMRERKRGREVFLRKGFQSYRGPFHSLSLSLFHFWFSSREGGEKMNCRARVYARFFLFLWRASRVPRDISTARDARGMMMTTTMMMVMQYFRRGNEEGGKMTSKKIHCTSSLNKWILDYFEMMRIRSVCVCVQQRYLGVWWVEEIYLIYI